MPSKRVNISIPEDQRTFLDENPSISPSKLFQASVETVQNSIKHNPQLIEALKQIELLKKKNTKIGEMSQEAYKFIEDHKLWEEFIKNAKTWDFGR